jgi:PEGA domain
MKARTERICSVSSVSPWCVLALIGCTLAGCVERRMVITSEPEGALVTLNDVEVGSTPCEVDFTYFGVYDVRLKKEGFEPLATKAEAKAPFHEWPVIDLVAMAIPVKKRTKVEWHFILEPVVEDRAMLIQRAEELRGQMPAGEPAASP